MESQSKTGSGPTSGSGKTYAQETEEWQAALREWAKDEPPGTAEIHDTDVLFANPVWIKWIDRRPKHPQTLRMVEGMRRGILEGINKKE